MMSILSVLVSILKYAGLILEIMLLILLILLVIILFVPFQYSFCFSGNKNIDADVKVIWLKKILYYHYVIKNSKKTIKGLYFFGRSLLKEEKVEEEEPPVHTTQDKISDIDIKEKSKKDVSPHHENESTYIKHTSNDVSRNKEKKSKNTIEHHKEEAELIKSIKREVEDLGDEMEEQVEEKDSFGIKDLLHYPNKWAVLSCTYEFLKKLFLHIKPRKLYCEIEFGLEDPSHTGYVLAGIGIMSPYFGNSVNIKANFEKKIFQGEISGRGRFSIGIILKYIIEFLLKPPVKQIVRLYFNKRKEDKNGIEFEE
ncbi:MAG: hypothetical protein PWP07_1566 [Epulopiscium sp.]|jgi:hypothetical protein|nr:hypothetical protein [Defluviitaleaceae bacterium]MDK2788321.1 hypothetical protein [Candidatus Epulonipiscium sp.]